MTRTPRLSCAFTLALPLLVACEESPKKEPTVTRERSQAVASPAGPAADTAQPTQVASSSSGSAAPKKARRALCGGKLSAEGDPAPKKPVSRRAASGEPELPELKLTGGFTWVNFWAAWCVPCREEIPRLMSWEKQLGAQGKNFRVTFVSLDDDERQLEKFLGEQPKGGLRSTYWLVEGKEREDWLVAARLDPDPELPVHLLLDAKGRIVCRVQGAVEDADFPDLSALLRG
jgi:thiol-disulfide isomerase/thioredoxin